MRVLLQRATSASVSVNGEIVGRLATPGLVALAAITHDDTGHTTAKMADKVWRLRILADEKSAADLDAPILVVSQFTLYANTRKGRRPSWSQAAPGDSSEHLINQFVRDLESLGATVSTGVFGADMQVTLTNDGPFTIWLDSADWATPRR